MHYLIVRILLPCSSNLAQVSEEDLIVMWAFLTGRQIEWAHLVRYCMHKALWSNASFPYPQLITLFLHHFKLNAPSLLVLEWSPLLATARSWMALVWRKMHHCRLQKSVHLLLHGVILLHFWMTFSQSYEDSKHMLIIAWMVLTHALMRWTFASTSLQETWTSFVYDLVCLWFLN